MYCIYILQIIPDFSICRLLASKRPSFGSQKAIFQSAKDGLLQGKRYHLDYQSVTSVVFLP